MSNCNGAKNFTFGFFAGAALGAIGALMMAPMSGRRLRRELSLDAHKFSNRVSETAEELKDKGSDVYGSTAEVVSDAARGLSRAAQSLAR
jgi:gas vesicle protein